MNNIFIDPNDNLFIEISPYTGKYAVNCRDFFEKVHNIHNLKMNKNWKYKPLNAEIEITTKCNQSCKHCGMGSNGNGMNGTSYTRKELEDFTEQLYANGVLSFSITGGEPFIEFENMLAMLRATKRRVDVCKISTNGFWGKNAADYFEQLEKAGLFENNFFIPCLMLSIGEQTIPLEYICNIIHYAASHYTSKQLTLCISSMREFDEPGKLPLFKETYSKMYGELPKQRIFLTQNFYRNSQYMNEQAKKIEGRFIHNYMSGPIRCFEHTIGKYVLPRMLIKVSGDVIPCSCFNPPEDLKTGNFRSQTIREILEAINNNPYVSIIAEGGLHNFKNYLPESDYIGVSCTNECDACRILINSYKNKINK